MPAKPTALVMQLATTDKTQRQQMLILPDRSVWRRTLKVSGRTQWRWAKTDSLADWVSNYTQLAANSSPEPMHINQGCVLMLVTEDEVKQMEDGAASGLPRTVHLRYQRVSEAMTEDPHEYPPTDQANVHAWISDWLTAIRDEDTSWLDRNTHNRGGTATPAPAPAVAPGPDPEPEPEPKPANPYGWTYPPIIDGYVSRPNGERYRTRTLEGKVDVELLRECRLNIDHVFLYGDPGTGKTALVDSAFGTDLVTMIGTEDTERSDFIGSYVPTGKPTKPYRWENGALIMAMMLGVPLFVDECGVISPRTMTILFSAMDGRNEIRVTENPKIGNVKAKPGFFVCLATNPHAPGVRISEALTSRVGLAVEIGTDYSLMRELGVPDSAVTVAENLLARRKADDSGLWVPQARELLRYQKQIPLYGSEIALRNLIAAAPEDDRETVIEVVKRVYGGAKRSWLTL